MIRKEFIEPYIPLGQKVLSSNYKKITKDDIYKRFNCAEISKQQLELATKEATDYYNEIKSEYSKLHWLKKLLIKFLEGCPEFVDYSMEYGRFHVRRRWNGESKLKKFHILECVPKFMDLEQYMEDKIPENCLVSVKKAQIFGFEKFQVAFPTLEKKSLTDLIIVGIVGEAMFEISTWK